MDGREFWMRWRGDILRGVVIFGLVLGGGLFVRSLAHRGRAQLNGLERAFDTDFFASDRQRAEPWTYVTPLAAQRTLWVRNVNGSITIEPADAGSVEIRAERTFRHSPADSVRIVTAESEKGITVCAVWPGPNSDGACGPDGHYTSEPKLRGNDVAVVFTVRLPRGVKIDASTINGDVEVRGASAPIGVGTVNGDVTVETSGGPVRAVTVNGDAQATIRGFAEPGDVNITTVHGDATLDLPDQVDAVLDGHTVTGDISSDYPLTIAGKFASHDLTGTLGKGGRRIHITTVAGDVQLRKASQAVQSIPAAPRGPVPPTPPRAPRSSTRASAS
jgi:cytoskeletal protein CcmA (bactofilin family)